MVTAISGSLKLCGHMRFPTRSLPSPTTSIDNYRYAEGLGLRIAWNVNILRFDYAVSKEDAQFFFNFGHTF
jgi:outer membrane protein assembly factor BamA